MNMAVLMMPILVVTVIFLPIYGCYALMTLQMSRKQEHPVREMEFDDHFFFAHPSATIPSRAFMSEDKEKYAHHCPVCGKKHFVNEARQRVAYGKQYSCGSGCEAVRRRAWRHAAPMPAQVDTGVCHADAAMADDQRKARVGQLEQNDHLRRKRKSIFEES